VPANAQFAEVRLSSRQCPQPLQPGTPPRRSPDLQAPPLGRTGRVAVAHGLSSRFSGGSRAKWRQVRIGLTAPEDRLAILDRLSRYNHAIDNLLPDAADPWADCFTEEGSLRAVTRSGARARDRLPDGMIQAAKPGDSERTDPL